MRHMKLLLHLRKGYGIHPKLRMFAQRSRPVVGRSIESSFANMTLLHGLGVNNQKVRKPLKFNC